jgi:flagellar biosynthesis protein
VAKSKIDPSKSIVPKNSVDKKLGTIDGANQKKERQKDSQRQLRRKTVALKNSSQMGKMPHVVASGQGSIAEQILQIAWANNIKVREDADLAEILSAIDINSEIPIEALAAVAEILTYVYKANAAESQILGLDETGEERT